MMKNKLKIIKTEISKLKKQNADREHIEAYPIEVNHLEFVEQPGSQKESKS